MLALGVALSLAQQAAITDEVFFSGDGGIKSLLAKQFARGEWHADLRLPAEPWVRELWDDGLYPFGQPFAVRRGDRWFVTFPAPFMALTAPFYRWLGFRGWTAVPLLGLCLAWGASAWLLRRLGVSPRAQVVGLAGLVFASFATPYGAMYWEHTLALGLSCAGLALLWPAPPERGALARSLAGGLLLGAAVFARPESAAFAVGAGAALPLLRRRAASCAAAWAGVAVAALLYAAMNLWLYGHPLGVQALRVMEPQHVPYTPGHRVVWFYLSQLLRLCPIVALVAVLALARPWLPSLRAGRAEAALWLVVLASLVGPAFLARHTGGDQIGARYVLQALPPLFALLALQWDALGQLPLRWRRSLRVLVLALLALGVHLNAVQGTQALYRNYRERIRPALEALRTDAVPVVAVQHQWMAQELASAFGSKRFFRVRDEPEFDRLARALLARGITRLSLVSYQDQQPGVYRGSGYEARLRPRGRFGSLVLVEATLVAYGAPAD